MDELSLSDIFKPFMEEEVEKKKFEKIIARLDAVQQPPDSSTCPIIFFNDLSEEESLFVNDYLNREEARVLAAYTKTAPSCIAPTEPWICPPAPDAISFFKMRQQRKEISSNSKKPNAYLLMQEFLSVCCVRFFKGDFYLFSGSVYVRLSEQELKTLIFQILEAHVAQCGGPQIIRQVAELLTSNPAIHVSQTTDDINHLYFRNGCLDLITGSFRSNGTFDFFVSYINVDYIPNNNFDCPHFNAYLRSVSGGNLEVMTCIWQMIGYLLVPDMSGKCFFLLQGVPDSGKSVLGDLIRSFFNPEAVAFIDIFRFKDKFSPSGLKRCRVNISMDLPSGKLSNEAIGMIKKLTGRDGVTLEEKFKDATPEVPTCKLVFGTNHPLCLATPDVAFENRLVLIPFRHTIPKDAQDPNLIHKLRQELPAIIPRALQAYLKLRAQNYHFALDCHGSGMDGGLRGYIPLAEIMEQFLKERCCFSEGAFTPTQTLLSAFNAFAAQRGVAEFHDPAQFSRHLNRFCAGRIHRDKQRVMGLPTNGYRGIALSEGGNVENE